MCCIFIVEFRTARNLFIPRLSPHGGGGGGGGGGDGGGTHKDYCCRGQEMEREILGEPFPFLPPFVRQTSSLRREIRQRERKKMGGRFLSPFYSNFLPFASFCSTPPPLLLPCASPLFTTSFSPSGGGGVRASESSSPLSRFDKPQMLFWQKAAADGTGDDDDDDYVGASPTLPNILLLPHHILPFAPASALPTFFSQQKRKERGGGASIHLLLGLRKTARNQGKGK